MEINPLHSNKSALSTFSNDLQKLTFQLTSLKLMLNRLENHLNDQNSSTLIGKSQLRAIRLELLNAQESIKLAKAEFSMKSVQEMGLIKNPNTTLVKLVEIFLILANGYDESWPQFKKLCKSPEVFLDKVKTLSPQTIPLNFQTTGGVFLNNYKIIHLKLKNYPKNVMNLGELIKSLLEFRLKEELLDQRIKENMRSIKKIDITKAKIYQVSLQIASIQDQIESMKGFNIPGSPKSIEYETGDCSFNSPYANKVIFSSKDLAEKTASRGLLNDKDLRDEGLMPQLDDGNECYFQKNRQDSFEMFYEYDEKLGCCRSNFFCF